MIKKAVLILMIAMIGIVYSSDSLTVSGKIVDLSGNGVDNAKIVSEDGKFTYTDGNGNYTIKVSKTFVPVDNPDIIIETYDNYKIKIYNILGQKVFENEFQNSSFIDFKWNGKSEIGEQISSGIYFPVIESNNKIVARSKMTIIGNELLNYKPFINYSTKQRNISSLSKKSDYGWTVIFDIEGESFDNVNNIEIEVEDDNDDGYGNAIPHNVDLYPVADFSVSPESGTLDTVYTFDAGATVNDDDLQIRWDWENDGIWDTEWSSVIKESHQYISHGEYRVKLEVKDTQGATDTCSITLIVDDSNYYLPDLKINEIYYSGPPNNFYYFYDQYIELYNASNDTIYLDGMIICREYIDSMPRYIFQFPGSPLGISKDFPIYPRDYKVIAMDAINHKKDIFGDSLSIDLSQADFEFKNSNDYGDVDNPNVPNLDNIKSGHTLDFFMNVSKDIIFIATGEDVLYIDGINKNTIIDIVEYSSDSDYQKILSDDLDKGVAGINNFKYSGMSIERISPGYDTNNSTGDFQLLTDPTPGFSN